VLHLHGAFPVLPDPAVAPLHQREQHRNQIDALFGEHVLVPLGPLLIDAAPQDPLGHERLEAIAEDVRRDAEILLDRTEASNAVSDIAQDQRRPPLPGDVERARDRARLLGEDRSLHRLVSLSLA
jgi:hypothetical protein